MGIKLGLEVAAIRKLYNWLVKDPEKNIPRIGDYIDKYVPENNRLHGQLAAIRKIVGDPENNWYKLLMDVFTNIDPGVRRAVFDNFVVEGTIRFSETHDKLTAQYDCNIPWAILMDPTSACNLHCIGCWAAEYGHKLNLTFEELDSIVTQGKELGIFFYMFTGGEPLVRKADLIKLCEKHNECAFHSYTNGTLVDQAFCDEMKRVGNLSLSISLILQRLSYSSLLKYYQY